MTCGYSIYSTRDTPTRSSKHISVSCLVNYMAKCKRCIWSAWHQGFIFLRYEPPISLLAWSVNCCTCLSPPTVVPGKSVFARHEFHEFTTSGSNTDLVVKIPHGTILPSFVGSNWHQNPGEDSTLLVSRDFHWPIPLSSDTQPLDVKKRSPRIFIPLSRMLMFGCNSHGWTWCHGHVPPKTLSKQTWWSSPSSKMIPLGWLEPNHFCSQATGAQHPLPRHHS